MSERLKKSVIQTLAYFSLFRQPLTKEELFFWRWDSPEKISQRDFFTFLAQGRTAGWWSENTGFYCLPGREADVACRQERVKINETKMATACQAIKKIFWVPFVRAVFVCNTVAQGTATADSDIDVLVVTRRGRIFFTRALVTLVASLGGVRRHHRKITDRLCLSFYIADDSLNLEKVALSSPDIYLSYWLRQLVPIYDPEDLGKSLRAANQFLAQFFLPQVSPELHPDWRLTLGRFGGRVKTFLEWLWGGSYGDLLEKQTREIQKTHMKLRAVYRGTDQPTSVVVTDSMLKFHEQDRRQQFKDQWQKILNDYGYEGTG
ncbi:MAG TPA: nucleotidyltransferase domain-containing protein [Patescibacteria group bacterium]|nr:nucleotidyltransferase domain-containing protein [Patescibacteria group bacterium]